MQVWKALVLLSGETETGAKAFKNTGAEMIAIPAGCVNIAGNVFGGCATPGNIVNSPGCGDGVR